MSDAQRLQGTAPSNLCPECPGLVPCEGCPNDPRPPVTTPSVEDVQRAIATVENSRRTHVEWATFIESGATWEPTADHVGDVQHHLQCIAGYDHVIAVLRSIESGAE